MIYKIASQKIEKKAILGEAAIALGAHLAQNQVVRGTAAKGRLGEHLALRFSPNLSRRQAVVNGGVNAISPEVPIIENEIREFLEKADLKNMSLRQKAALNFFAKGDWLKLRKRNLLEHIHPKYGKLLQELPDESVKRLQETYKSGPLGQISSDMVNYLKKNKDARRNFSLEKKHKKLELTSEIANNAALGTIDPVIPLFNGVKRFGASKLGNNNKFIGETRKQLRDTMVEHPAYKDMDKGLRGEALSRREKNYAYNVVNPITGHLRELSNVLGQEVAQHKPEYVPLIRQTAKDADSRVAGPIRRKLSLLKEKMPSIRKKRT